MTLTIDSDCHRARLAGPADGARRRHGAARPGRGPPCAQHPAAERRPRVHRRASAAGAESVLRLHSNSRIGEGGAPGTSESGTLRRTEVIDSGMRIRVGPTALVLTLRDASAAQSPARRPGRPPGALQARYDTRAGFHRGFLAHLRGRRAQEDHHRAGRTCRSRSPDACAGSTSSPSTSCSSRTASKIYSYIPADKQVIVSTDAGRRSGDDGGAVPRRQGQSARAISTSSYGEGGAAGRLGAEAHAAAAASATTTGWCWWSTASRCGSGR